MGRRSWLITAATTNPGRRRALTALADRVRAVGVAWLARDEQAARAELRLLAQEAELLAVSAPMFRDPIVRRQEIAVAAERQRIC